MWNITNYINLINKPLYSNIELDQQKIDLSLDTKLDSNLLQNINPGNMFIFIQIIMFQLC